jgi:hypothetical protein
LASILGVPKIKFYLDRLLENNYIKLTATSIFYLDSEEYHSGRCRYQLSANVNKTLTEKFYAFNPNPSIDYFLRLNWQGEAKYFGNQIELLGPYLSLFRQAQKQSLSYSVIALSEIISDIALSLGFWGLRQQILLKTAQVPLLSSDRAKIYFDLGLQEICMGDYEKSLRHLELASQMQTEQDSSKGAYFIDHYNFINHYKRLASQKLRAIGSFHKTIEAKSYSADSPKVLSNLNRYIPSTGRQRLVSNFKVNRKFLLFALKWTMATMGASALVYGWLTLMRQQFLGVGRVPPGGHVASPIKMGQISDEISPIAQTKAEIEPTFNDLKNIDLPTLDEPRVDAQSQKFISRLPVMPGINYTNSQQTDFAQESSPQLPRQNVTVTSSEKILSPQIETGTNSPSPLGSQTNYAQNTEIASQDLALENSTNSAGLDEANVLTNAPNNFPGSNNSTLRSSTDSGVQNGQHQILSSLNESEDTLSDSMCSFLVSELDHARSNTNQNPEMYIRLLEEGNCQL